MILDITYLDGSYPSGLLHDRQAKVNALPAPCSSGRLQSAGGEELRPFFGRTLMPSVLRPQGGAFKGEL
jgi:hypothetical protein